MAGREAIEQTFYMNGLVIGARRGESGLTMVLSAFMPGHEAMI
jgi:hypothetical protein